MEDKIWEFGTALFGSAVFGLIGFVWKISHRVTATENKLAAMERRHGDQIDTLRREMDSLSSGLDKNREWTTNRMLSIAKDMKD
ncbi:hypothetical protein [Herbaspirillum sp.]|uniref:hypothetical protein n=1 Tax=Herbaspirillum sp. TaxID=1890675 RepID=UPI00257DF898|nr:hypothetical protein [Herbaspirillum sp.]|tara:strand:+ start:4984 stop:5235 length:252 start_codon:yes stop_codon:yes gene_type:complete